MQKDTLKFVLTIDVEKRRNYQHIYVNSVYLNCDIQETVFMEQPENI